MLLVCFSIYQSYQGFSLDVLSLILFVFKAFALELGYQFYPLIFSLCFINVFLFCSHIFLLPRCLSGCFLTFNAELMLLLPFLMPAAVQGCVFSQSRLFPCAPSTATSVVLAQFFIL